MADNANPELDKAIAAGGIVEGTASKETPSYKVLGDSKIPVSKSVGTVWKSRRDAALKNRSRTRVDEAWDEAFRYYFNDQLSHRVGVDDGAGNSIAASQDNATRTHSETENIVYANVNALVPSLFSKNPEPEITVNASVEEGLNTIRKPAERLLKVLGGRKYAPGFNLKSRIRRAIVLATLTNNAWISVDYIRRADASEQARADVLELAARYEKEKDPKEIELIEQKLAALETKFNFLRPSGFRVRVWSPHQVLIDPANEEDDLSDANWVMYYDYMPTAYLRAVYYNEKKGSEGKEFESIYAPTHVADVSNNSTEDLDEMLANFTLLEEGNDESYKKYGYASKQAFDAAKFTKVWYVWDAVTRRVLLFNDKNWTYPIWVWDDPYKLQEFYNITKLSFVTDPQGGDSRGEVSYYLDQQDAINTINSEEARAREWAKRNVFFDLNTGLTQSDVESFLRGPTDSAKGVALPEGKKPEDIVWTLKPPFSNHKELFQKDHKYAAIDRISQVNATIRGEEFKTNTTNQAIARYEQSTNIRLDDRIDRVEEVIGDIYWKVLQIALQEMTVEDVTMLIGSEDAALWRNFDYQEIAMLSLNIEGGSTQKPTSAAKKKEAVEVGQLLGQFVQASPMALVVALQLFEKSFDEINIKEEHWKLIEDSILQTIQGQQSPDKLATTIDQLPPEAKKALGEILARGVPIEKAVATIVNQLTPSQGEPTNGAIQ